MVNALIGYTGFVGSTLLKQNSFSKFYRSTNINEINNGIFDVVVCAGAPAQKWLANKEPEVDKEKIENLIIHLETIKTKTFILISTVDVFKNPLKVDEISVVDETNLHAYGVHRRLLEKFVMNHFSNYLIVRLPGLVGPGLRKNIIFDLLNNNNLHAIDSRAVFQFYPMVNLWYDIKMALQARLNLIHLTAEPISVREIAEYGFGKSCIQTSDIPPASYDMRTRYAELFGTVGNYQYNHRETLQAVRAYAQSESISISQGITS